MGKNEFIDVIFWLATVCFGAMKKGGDEEDANMFVSLRGQLSSEQENNDLAAYRRSVTESFYDNVMLLVEKKIAILKNDNQGNNFDEKIS